MIPKPLLLASTNEGKFQELVGIASEYGVQLLRPADVANSWLPAWGPNPPREDPPLVEEGVVSYEENARLKAEAYYAWSGLPSLSDDTGLEVDALGGEPGVATARYAGVPEHAERNVEKLLLELQHARNRRARFRCVLHLMWGKNLVFSGEGVLEGEIARERSGTGGFGYDCIFVLESSGISLATVKGSQRPGQPRVVETHRCRAAHELFRRLNSSPLVPTEDYTG